MFEELNSIKSDREDLKNFGFTIGFILMMIGVFLFVKEKDSFIYFFLDWINICWIRYNYSCSPKNDLKLG